MLQLKEDAQIDKPHSNTDTKGNGAEEASALLNGTETGAEARWAALSDADLDDEIAAFRRGIRNVSNELESLGVTFSIDEAQPEAQGGPEDAEVSWMRSCLPSEKGRGISTLEFWRLHQPHHQHSYMCAANKGSRRLLRDACLR